MNTVFIYTPTVRGRHELIVTASGQEVAGSPFPVFVSIHPTELVKPVRVITEAKRPRYLAVNSLGETIIALVEINDYYGYNEDKGNLVVFDKEVRSTGDSFYNVTIMDPYGVAVDDKDNIYVVNFSDKQIHKLNNELKIIKVVRSEHDAMLFGVAVIGDEVMVWDRKNCIMVYTKELEYLRQIDLSGKDQLETIKSIVDLSSDKHGNLYICDSGNSRIHVLSNSRDEYLRSFGCDGSSVNKLKVPCGICVAGKYVYVTNRDSHTLVVYTTEGVYVISFGQYGRKEGQFNIPTGVVVDRDGFVYICDGNDRVQIF